MVYVWIKRSGAPIWLLFLERLQGFEEGCDKASFDQSAAQEKQA